MTRRIKHAKTATVVPSVAFTDWNAWLVDEADQVIDLNSLSGSTVFNDAGADVNWRMESDTREFAFAFYGRRGNIGLGIDLSATTWDPWGLVMSYPSSDPLAGYDGGGMLVSTNMSAWTVDDNNTISAVRAQASVVNAAKSGGYPTSSIAGVRGSASTYGTNTEIAKLFGGSFEARNSGKHVDEIYGVMSQACHQSYEATCLVDRVTGIYSDAYTSDPGSGKTLNIGAAYGAELRTFCKTNYAGSVSHIDLLYGLFSSVYCQQAVGGTSTIDDAYNVYLYHNRPGGGIPEYGLVGNYYGLYSASLAAMNATNKWAVYIVDGVSYFGGKIGIGTDSPAVSAALEIASTTQVLLLSRMSTTEKNALTPVNGMVVYDTTLGKFQGYQAGAWTSFA